MRFFKANEKGFTLGELLVTIAIIALLSTIVLASMSEARKKARDKQRVSDIAQIQLALRLYKDANGEYPSDPVFSGGETIGEGGQLDSILAEYMSAVPHDPLGSPADTTYEYMYHTQTLCDNLIVGENYIVIYTLTTEDPTLANWPTVCESPGTGDEVRYGVVLQKI